MRLGPREMADPSDNLHPADAGELVETVRWAAGARARLEVTGAGTKRALGNPTSARVRLLLERLDGIVAYEPEELILTARPGTRMTEIEALLARHGQMLAFEPPDWGPLFGAPAGQASLGGTIGCNASGPRRVRAGAARDHMLGLAAVSGRGEIFKAGGKVVKNVTGYDLPKLLTGAFGTLGVMTELTLKALPRPEAAGTLVYTGRDDRSAIRLLRDAASLPYEASGLAHLPPAAAARLGLPDAATLIRLEGAAATLSHRLDGMRGALRAGTPEVLGEAETAALWRDVRDVGPFARGSEIVWRVSAPPAAGPDIAREARADLYFYDWAGGLLWLRGDPGHSDAGARNLRRAVAAGGGGHATLFRAPEALRAAIPVFEPEPPALAALSRRVKAAFDPLNILNPGRLVPIS